MSCQLSPLKHISVEWDENISFTSNFTSEEASSDRVTQLGRDQILHRSNLPISSHAKGKEREQSLIAALFPNGQ